MKMEIERAEYEATNALVERLYETVSLLERRVAHYRNHAEFQRQEAAYWKKRSGVK